MRESMKAVGPVGGPERQLFRRCWLLMGAVVLVLLFPSHPVLADETDDELQTVYHVYMGDIHLGQVSDKDVVDDIVDKKMQRKQDEYEHLDLTTSETISYISEKSFHPHLNEENVREKLTEDLKIEAKVHALTIDGEIVGYFKNKQTVSKLLNTYKANYVNEDILEEMDKQTDTIQFNKQMENPDKGQSLEPGESRITNVSFSKDVDVSEATVSPDKVLTKKKGLKLLEKGTLEDEIHLVEEGEVLESIASDYDLSADEILRINPDLTADSILQIDQEIHVTAYQPYMDVLVEKEQVDEKKVPFDKEIEKTDELYKGEKEVVQEGKDGKEEVYYSIQEKNGKQVSKEVSDYQVVKEPVAKIIRKGTKVISSRGTGEIGWPVDGGYISSYVGERWGRMHKGIDIARPNSRTITAADNGVVTEAGYAGGYGNKIVINHNNGMKTVYAHLSSIDVQVGQTVEKGHPIGIMGSTGNSTGVHLHFELYIDGALKKPNEYIQS